MLRIRSLYNELQLNRFLTGCLDFSASTTVKRKDVYATRAFGTLPSELAICWHHMMSERSMPKNSSQTLPSLIKVPVQAARLDRPEACKLYRHFELDAGVELLLGARISCFGYWKRRLKEYGDWKRQILKLTSQCHIGSSTMIRGRN